MNPKNLLVIGSGGREHALVWKLRQSQNVGTIYVAPGNGGTAQMAGVKNIDYTGTQTEKLAAFAEKNDIHLTVVGPDGPLADGIVDLFRSCGLRIFGPTVDAARIESSKLWGKTLMEHTGVPTAQYQLFSDYKRALEYVRRRNFPIVIKANGLALGKGAYVCTTLVEAERALSEIMLARVHGSAGDRLIIEEFLPGTEISAHALCDGIHHKTLPLSKDYKRRYDGNHGPNTGGMGAIAPVLLETPGLDTIDEQIIAPILGIMGKMKAPFTGCLYPGLMIAPPKANVLEFNARFGDPETQVYMMLLENDLLGLLDACVDGTLDKQTLMWRPGFAACVVLVAQDYPKRGAVRNCPIALPGSLPDDVQIFHAGTTLSEGRLVASGGGRVLCVTAVRGTLAQARLMAYDVARYIYFYGIACRTDIGADMLK